MKQAFTPVDSSANFPQMEEETLSFWKTEKIFEKSLEKDSPQGKWNFLDGPPFVTGMPHYGSLLSSLPKDAFGRYWTMKGYHVRRVWGWDGHGLPIENKVEGELEIKSKKEIETKIGVKKFIERCLHYVNQVSSEWEWYVDHIGRWADFKNAYKTWDTPYMESVMWVFKQLYEKGHVYKGLRVSLYCPHCATPISNFEVAMDAENHKEIQDAATTYKYELIDKSFDFAQDENKGLRTFILAWSTTPWNKIVTSALAVNPEFTYVKVEQNGEKYILAKTTLKMLVGEYKILEEFKGSTLVGKKFVPHYDYYKIEAGEKAFVIIPGDFVTADEGTGVVTMAAYGEEDLKAMQENNIHIEMHVDEEGTIKQDVPKFGGMYYLKANKAVNADLQERGLTYKDELLPHVVPLCWRCHTRLYHAPMNAWYVDVQKLKPLLIKTNEDINWQPEHFKNGRFLKSLESAPDWNISRNRYWGSPVPVWECECGQRFVPGSIAELEQASGKKITNLHKPEIDEVTTVCKKCGKTMHRTPEVLDSWIEAGSAAFAERHFPFEKDTDIKDFFPPDFIAEYTGQIRAWFYVLHVIAGALYGTKAFKNVLVSGVILGTDGRKMSKNFKNYPDPKEMLGRYGGDALRLYLLGNPVSRGEDMLISEDQYKMQVRGTMLILWNTYNFFVTYANADAFEIPSTKSSPRGEAGQIPSSKNVLDEWVLALLAKLVEEVTTDLEAYNTVSAIEKIKKFIDSLSTWYIRRSRDRVGPAAVDAIDKNAFYATTHVVLTTLCKILAPLAPFISEAIYKNLTGEASVHLATWPTEGLKKNEKLLEEMEVARKIAELGHASRKEKQIKVKQPLQKLTVTTEKGVPSLKDRPESIRILWEEKIFRLLKDELNLKEVAIVEGNGELSVALDTTITPALKAEGQARDIVRKIQEERKKLGTKLDEKIVVTLEEWPKEFEEEIKRKTLIATLSKGEFSVKVA